MAQVPQGFQSGVAPSNAINALLRQTTSIAAMIAAFAADNGGPMVDDGDTATQLQSFLTALQTLLAAINGSASKAFNVADAATATEALPLGQAQANFAAINGSASEAFTANGFTTTDFFTSTGAAAFLQNANYSASVNAGNSGYIEHYVASATTGQAAVNATQLQNGTFTPSFASATVANVATSGGTRVPNAASFSAGG
ncbi:MAG: hypothetical protein PHS51_03445, partial [Gallionella sp.]|nr:hypothetical protein [Gallionella sp.]